MTDPTYTADDRGLRAALDYLGPTPDAVADTLLRLGIRGERHISCRCPVAVYIRRVMPIAGDDQSNVAVGPDQITVLVVGDMIVQVDTPPPVAGFIRACDQGGYPAVAPR